jgi:hypothetical protein
MNLQQTLLWKISFRYDEWTRWIWSSENNIYDWECLVSSKSRISSADWRPDNSDGLSRGVAITKQYSLVQNLV